MGAGATSDERQMKEFEDLGSSIQNYKNKAFVDLLMRTLRNT